MSETIVLDKPEQINLWVLLSRRHQIQLHLKGLQVKGLVKWLKANFPEAGIRTARDGIVPVEYAISQAGGEIDYNLVNVHIMLNRGGLFFDKGVFSDPDVALAEHPEFGKWYSEGSLEVVLVTDEPRNATDEIFVPA